MNWLLDRIGWPRREPTRFLLMFQGRSGSTHLMHHLRSHTRIKARLEMFVGLEKSWPAQRQAMDELLLVRRARRLRAIGFKTKFVDVADPAALSDYIATHRLSIIHMFRANPVKLAVSIVRAARLRDLHGDSNAYKDEQRLGRLEIRPAEFQEALQRSGEYEKLRQFVDRLETPRLDVSYEELFAEERATLARVFDFLSVPFEKTWSKTYKNTPDDLADAVSNLDELRRSFPELESYFD